MSIDCEHVDGEVPVNRVHTNLLSEFDPNPNDIILIRAMSLVTQHLNFYALPVKFFNVSLYASKNVCFGSKNDFFSCQMIQ